MDWALLIWMLALGVSCYWRGWVDHKKSIEHPYKWKCHEAECDFAASANDMRAVDIIATNHEKYHKEKL